MQAQGALARHINQCINRIAFFLKKIWSYGIPQCYSAERKRKTWQSDLPMRARRMKIQIHIFSNPLMIANNDGTSIIYRDSVTIENLLFYYPVNFM
jgi:hypothetical protein